MNNNELEIKTQEQEVTETKETVSAFQKIENGVVTGYKKIENGVVTGYKKIENGVVTGYKKIETGIVEGFQKVTDKCVEVLFSHEGETVEDTKKRLRGEDKE